MKKIKVHSLTGRITWELMQDAFLAVKRNHGAAGVDRVPIDTFEENLEQNLKTLMTQLKDRSFKPQALRRVHVDKGGGKTRPLGIPTVRDRVAQEVIRQLLNPIFERLFHPDSYGFRPERGCHMAVERLLKLKDDGFQFVLDADIKGFFDNLPHQVIMDGLAAEIADGNILTIVERFLKAGVMEEGVFSPTAQGTPQGGVISPLLANIALNRLDWKLQEAGYHFVRYADDFVVLCQAEAQVCEAHKLVQQTLTEIGLTLSPEKTKMTHFSQGFLFLGFEVTSRYVRMREKSVEKFKTRIRELTTRSHNLDETVVTKVNQVVRGVANYFATTFSNVVNQFRTLDAWLRMRLRAMKCKRKTRRDNCRIRNRTLNGMGFLFLSDLNPRTTRKAS